MGEEIFEIDILNKPKRVWLEDGGLHYDGYGQAPARLPLDGLLDSFIRIEGSDDVLRFADRWGPLYLCKHGFPETHADNRLPRFDFSFERMNGRPKGCYDKDSEGFNVATWSDPVSRWLDFTHAARSMLNLASVLHGGGLGLETDWENVFATMEGAQSDVDQLSAEARRDSSAAKEMLAQCITEWLAMADIFPMLDWKRDEPSFLLSSPFVFGAVAIQVMQAVSRSNSLATCSGCGVPYLRTGRKAPVGRRNYCPTCGLKTSLRDAQRAHRARQRS